ncbi:hypothetical protein GBAR_LOCUS29717, partial [Geodia barretti]
RTLSARLIFRRSFLFRSAGYAAQEVLVRQEALEVCTRPSSSFGVVAGPSFSQEQQRHFDVAGDPDYVSWLRINHPDSPLLRHPTGPQTSASSGKSLLHHFSDVTPVAEIAVDSPPPDTDNSTKKHSINVGTLKVPDPSSSVNSHWSKRRATSGSFINKLCCF